MTITSFWHHASRGANQKGHLFFASKQQIQSRALNKKRDVWTMDSHMVLSAKRFLIKTGHDVSPFLLWPSSASASGCLYSIVLYGVIMR